MDGRNSSGRKVSLLNDTCVAAPSLAPVAAPRSNAVSATTLPPLTAITNYKLRPYAHSESPSEASTPGLTPQTPPLIRSESSDSRAFASPSPLTPQSTSFEGTNQKQQHQSYYLYRQPWSKMDDPAMYPPIPEGGPISAYSLPPLAANTINAPLPQIRSSDSPVSDSRVSTASLSGAGSAQKQNTKKSQYPCPLAKQFKCNDYFTTSGHAARHAKKHTGRKDAICPECNKAFTRKDNMEQHRRTHQNVRGPSTKTSADNRVKKPTKQGARKGDRGSISGPLETAVLDQLDQAPVTLAQPVSYPLSNGILEPALMPAAGGPYFMNPDPVSALPQPMSTDYSGRPPLYRANYNSSLDFTSSIQPTLGDPENLHFNYPSPGLSNGLNTLALVASDHRRMSGEGASSKSSKSASTTP